MVTKPSWLEIPRSKFKETTKLWITKRSTKDIISLNYSYDEIVFSAMWTRLNFTFNESYSLENKWGIARYS